MKIYLSGLDITLLVSGAILICVGALIFFATGIYKVKKKHVIIIEKVEEYHKTVSSGFHYFMPLIYKKVGCYCIAPQQIGITLENGNKIYMTYQIEDAQKYHYCPLDVKSYLLKINREHNDITIELLKEEYEKIGIKFISIKQ